MYDLGALIRSLRKERKLTQKKLGEMLDVTEGTISKYEANTMTPPFETLRSIASIFNVSMDTLCGMKHQGTLSTHGLTEAQTETVKALVDAYRIKNAQTGRQHHTYTIAAFTGSLAIRRSMFSRPLAFARSPTATALIYSTSFSSIFPT